MPCIAIGTPAVSAKSLFFLCFALSVGINAKRWKRLQKIHLAPGGAAIAPAAWLKHHNRRETAKMLDLLALGGAET